MQTLISSIVTAVLLGAGSTPTAPAPKDQTDSAGALGAAEGELGKSEEQLAAEQKARAATKQRAKDALDKLAQAGVSVGKESRGTVITIPSSDLFDPGQTKVLSSAEDKLTQVADALKEQGDRKILVEGYTDSHGSSEDTSRVLSQERADAVRSFLVTLGVPGDRIEAHGLGSAKPVASNDNDEGRADNRRVEIVVVKPIKPK